MQTFWNLLCNRNLFFLNRIVTCDEKWILYYSHKCSAQWLDADKTPQHFPKPKLNNQKKVMVIIWWPSACLMHHSFIKPSESIIAKKYCREIDEMHQKLTRIQPALVNRKGYIFLHDNTRPHVSGVNRQKLYTLNSEILNHPPYLLDLSPTVFHFSNISITSYRRNA